MGSKGTMSPSALVNTNQTGGIFFIHHIINSVQLTACLGTMLSNDYPEKWPGYMNSVQELLSAPTAEGVRIGLLALKEVVGVYQ